jgi:hypothetical protein
VTGAGGVQGSSEEVRVSQEARREAGCRAIVELAGAADLFDPTIPEDGETIGER